MSLINIEGQRFNALVYSCSLVFVRGDMDRSSATENAVSD